MQSPLTLISLFVLGLVLGGALIKATERTSNRIIVMIIWAVIIALSLTSCSRRTVDLEKSKTSSELKLYNDSSSEIKVKTALRTTAITQLQASSRYQVTFVPDGEFRFDPATGFYGKAKGPITITGDQALDIKSSDTVDQKSDSSAVKKGSSSSSQKSAAQTKGKKTQASSWISLLWLIPLAAVGYILYQLFSYVRLKNIS